MKKFEYLNFIKFSDVKNCLNCDFVHVIDKEKKIAVCDMYGEAMNGDLYVTNNTVCEAHQQTVDDYTLTIPTWGYD